MKPAQFEYHAPATIEEAVALLKQYSGEAKVLAGGQSLVPLMNFRLSRPAALVDLNRIDALAYIKEESGQLRFGAMTRQRTIEHSDLVRSRIPLMTEATELVGHLPIRTRGTIGGSVAHADPAAEYPAVVTALEGELVVRGPGGERVVRPAEFFVTYLTTSLAPDEILTEVRLPFRRAAAAGPSRSSAGGTATLPSRGSPRLSWQSAASAQKPGSPPAARAPHRFDFGRQRRSWKAAAWTSRRSSGPARERPSWSPRIATSTPRLTTGAI